MTNTVDLTIIGAGPSGLLSALWAARQGLTVCLLERKKGPLDRGHADGLEPRTLEILDSLGLADNLWQQANRTVEICTWCDPSGQLRRTSRRPNYARGTSRYQEATLHQGHIEKALVSALEREPSVTICWNSVSTSLVVAEDVTKFPVSVAWYSGEGKVQHRVRSHYVVGCDGARSWTRSQIGVEMSGNSTEELWGVVDIIPQTDFPDIRCRCIIRSASDTMMIIPREGHMVRFYVRLHDLEPDRHEASPLFNQILSRIRTVLAPYTLDIAVCDWWSSYRIRQQLATAFSDPFHRVFLAGDAIHTHSPKAGQGLNVSIQDAWNLGWKLAAVIKGQAGSALLRTYEIERRPVAQRLLSFDKKMLKHFQSFSICRESNGHGNGSLEAVIEEEHSSASGIEVSYAGLGPRSVADTLSSSAVAPGIKLGHRIGDFNVVRHVDGLVQSFHRILPANGRWRALVFSGDIGQEEEQRRRLDCVGDMLTSRKMVPLTLELRAECEAILIHASLREDVEILDVPAVFRPRHKSRGWDYDKVFVDDPGYPVEQYTSVYERLGISRRDGCLVMIRPDQHVSFIGALGVLF